MKAYRRIVKAKLHLFLTSALDRGELLTSRPGSFNPDRLYPLNWGPAWTFGSRQKPLPRQDSNPALSNP